jgi:S1-C subfamily serine protease
LVEAGGRVAGINSSALMRGVSVAVPAATINRVVAALLAHGKMPRGYLGISIQPVRLADGLQQSVGQETGLMLMSVESGSPAQQGGLVQGDVIVGLDGQAVRGMDELQALLNSDRVGKNTPVRIVRSGQVQTLNVTIGQG